MSKMRSTIVREESLAGFTKACGFEQYIRLGKGEENLVVVSVPPFSVISGKPSLELSIWIKVCLLLRNF